MRIQSEPSRGERSSAGLRAVLAVAAVALAITVWFVVRGSGSGTAAEVTARGAASLGPGTDRLAAGTPANADQATARRPAGGATEEPVPPAIDRDVDLHGLVLDPGGSPVGGATVEVWRDEDADELSLLGRPHDPTHIARTETEQDGSFRVPLVPGRLYVLEAEAAGFARASVTHRYAGEYVEIRLSRPSSINGFRLRAADQLPVPDAEVMLRPTYGSGGSRTGTRRSVRTSSAGKFVIPEVSAGVYFLQALPREEAASESIVVELASGQSLRRDLEVGQGLEITGSVVDAVTKRPLATALISEGWSFRRTVETDALGEFRFRGLSDGQDTLHARAAGYGESEIRFRDDEGELPLARVEFELLPAHRARGRVVDPDGEPVAGVTVGALASEYKQPHGDQHTDWRSAVTDGDGQFELDDLRPDVAHTLIVRKEGCALVVYEFPGDERETIIELGEIVLPPGLLLRGIVVDESERPYPDLPVTMVGANSDRGRFPGSREPTWLIDTYAAERDTRTDDLGRFAFADLAAGTYRITVVAPGSHREESVEVTLDGERKPDPVRLVLARGLTIAGWVTVTDGGPLPEVYVRAESGGESADAMAQLDGSFELLGLVEGTYSITAEPYLSEEEEAAGRRLASVRLRAIETGERDVQIRLEPQLVTSGLVLDRAGDPVELAYIEARHDDGHLLDSTFTDAQGRFAIGLAPGESVDLVARPPPKNAKDGGIMTWDEHVWGRATAVPAGEQVTLRVDWTPY